MRLIKAVAGAALFGVALGGWRSFDGHSANPAAIPVVNIVARDFAFDPIPDVPAGVVELRLLNEGPSLHHAAVIKLNHGKTVEDLVAALKKPGPPPAWAMPIPSPNAPAPKEYSNVTTRLTPGNYAVLCFVDAGGSPPHFMKGMYRAFKVVPSKNVASAPATDLTIDTFDYGFKLSKPLTAGSHQIRVTDTGKQVHEIELIQLAPGKSISDMMAWIGGPMKTPPPGKPMGGVVDIAPGQQASFNVNLTRGQWGLICFEPDTKDGKPHFMHGMVTQVAVK